MRNYIQRKLSQKGKLILNFVKDNKCTKTHAAKRVSELYKIPLSTVKLAIKKLEKGELLSLRLEEKSSQNSSLTKQMQIPINSVISIPAPSEKHLLTLTELSKIIIG